MTYKDLLLQLERLQKSAPEKMEKEVLIYDESYDSFFPIGNILVADEKTHIDMEAGAPYINMKK